MKLMILFVFLIHLNQNLREKYFIYTNLEDTKDKRSIKIVVQNNEWTKH